MAAVYRRISRFLRAEDGPTATEYAVLLALIAVGVIGAMSMFGVRVESIYTALQGTLSVF